MKKIILIVTSTMIVLPINSQSFNKIINSNSYTIECMASRKCKDGVKRIYDISDISSSYPDSDFDIIADEFNRMLATLKRIGIKVFLGDEKYFPKHYRGIYSTRRNNFYLNDAYAYNPKSLIGTMRHEGWHVAQDCKAGIHNMKLDTIIEEKNIPPIFSNVVEKIYADEPDQIPYEKGAFWASIRKDATQKALESCVSGKLRFTY